MCSYSMINVRNLFFFSRFSAGVYPMGLIARTEKSLQAAQNELKQQGRTGGLFLSTGYLYQHINI